MTTRLFATALLAASMATASACGSSATTNVTSPATVRCQPTVTASSSTFAASGGSATATVSVSRECAWNAASGASWIVITSPAQGQGDGTIAYRVEPNADPVTRKGALTVADSSHVDVTQEAAPCRYEVSAPPEPLAADNAEAQAQVHTHAACGWTATSGAAWLSVTPASGTGDSALRLSAAANSGGQRSTQVRIGDQSITVTQLAVTDSAPPPGQPPAPPPPPPPPQPPPPDPAPVSPIDLDGTIAGVSGTCPLLIFVLDGKAVFTTSATVFKKMPCKDVKNGVEVKVSGYLMSDGTVRADQVEKK